MPSGYAELLHQLSPPIILLKASNKTQAAIISRTEGCDLGCFLLHPEWWDWVYYHRLCWFNRWFNTCNRVCSSAKWFTQVLFPVPFSSYSSPFYWALVRLTWPVYIGPWLGLIWGHWPKCLSLLQQLSVGAGTPTIDTPPSPEPAVPISVVGICISNIFSGWWWNAHRILLW